MRLDVLYSTVDIADMLFVGVVIVKCPTLNVRGLIKQETKAINYFQFIGTLS